MNKYDFDAVVSRKGTNSIKHDFMCEHGKPDDVLPMWVADMDFTSPPEVTADIQRAAAHGVFGYAEPKADYYASVSTWFGERFGYVIRESEIVKSPGVVFALAQAVRAFTEPGGAVMIQTPVYGPFYEVVRKNNRILVTNPLIYKNYTYSMDYEDMEQKIHANNVKMFILCSPHNPVGRVWTRGELNALNEICVRNGVIVVSDEIHCDFVWTGHTHTCFGLINENSVIGAAPSKTFNLAGLQASNIFIKNAELRRKFNDEMERNGCYGFNSIGSVACQSAYTHGGVWLDELRKYLEANIKLTRDFLETHLPKIKMIVPEGTFLVWLDFSACAIPCEDMERRLTEDARLWFSGGGAFGAGDNFQRVNIACPRSVLAEALNRLKAAFANL